MTPTALEYAMDADGQALIASLPELLPMGAQPAALVTVIAAQGSAPRGPGARMVVRDDVRGEGHNTTHAALLAGTIGGGHLEQLAMDEACALLAKTPDFQPVIRDWALGPALAQCCGGRVTLRLEPLSADKAQQLATSLRAAESASSVFVTGAHDHELRERPAQPWTILIFGAGHVARALATVLQVQPWQVIVVDERPTWADAAAFPAGTQVCAEPPVQLLQRWGWLGAAPTANGQRSPSPNHAPRPERTLAVVMTHDHDLDRQLAWALLRRRDLEATPLAHIGVIGSKTKIATLRRRLSDLGISEVSLIHLTAPIGLRHTDATGQLRPIGGKRPGEIAISVAAELLVTIAALDKP